LAGPQVERERSSVVCLNINLLFLVYEKEMDSREPF
jgi:hypothetical protein